jgi:hypothetical protein
MNIITNNLKGEFQDSGHFISQITEIWQEIPELSVLSILNFLLIELSICMILIVSSDKIYYLDV